MAYKNKWQTHAAALKTVSWETAFDSDIHNERSNAHADTVQLLERNRVLCNTSKREHVKHVHVRQQTLSILSFDTKTYTSYIRCECQLLMIIQT